MCARQKFNQFRLCKVLLLAAVHIAQDVTAAFEFVFADDQSVTRRQVAGNRQRLFQLAIFQINPGAHPGGAQPAGQRERVLTGLLADVGHVHVGRFGPAVEAAFGHTQDHALHAQRKAEALDRRAAE